MKGEVIIRELQRVAPRELCAKQIIAQTGLGPWRVYGTLQALEERRTIVGRWAEGSARVRLYSLPKAA